MLTEAIKELSKEFPSLAEPLIYERDRYMVRSCRLSCYSGIPPPPFAMLLSTLAAWLTGAPFNQRRMLDTSRRQVHCLRSLSMRGAERVVAVVGAGHMPGMRENWEKEIDMEEVSACLQPPPPPPLMLWGASLSEQHVTKAPGVDEGKGLRQLRWTSQPTCRMLAPACPFPCPIQTDHTDPGGATQAHVHLMADPGPPDYCFLCSRGHVPADPASLERLI